MVYLIHRTNEKLLRHEEENSSLKKEFNSCVEEMGKLQGKLSSLHEHVFNRTTSRRLERFSRTHGFEVGTEEEEELEGKSSACMEVPTADNAFASPSPSVQI